MTTMEDTGLRGLEQRLLVDTSEERPVFLLEGKNRTYMRLSASAYELLKLVEGGASFAQLAESINQRGGQAGKVVSASDVEGAYQKVVERIAKIEAKSAKLTGPFWFTRPLIPESIVQRIASYGAALYHPIAVLAFFGLIGVAVALSGSMMHGFRVNASYFGAGYGLFILSLLAHEFGHASACARYGARPSEIGFTFYLIYPAFYSNVSSAWALRRWQRVAVDLGGVYFQLIVAAGYAIAYALHPHEALRTALVLIAGSCLFSLNPILKFDGYWVVADALGVTNLGKQPPRLFRHALDRLRGREVKPLPWPPRMTLILLVYSIVSFAFWTYFMVRLVPYVLSHAQGYAISAVELGRAFMRAPPWPDRSAIGGFLTSTYMLLFALIALLRLARTVLGLLVNWIRKRGAGPAARAEGVEEARPG